MLLAAVGEAFALVGELVRRGLKLPLFRSEALRPQCNRMEAVATEGLLEKPSKVHGGQPDHLARFGIEALFRLFLLVLRRCE